MDVKTLKSAADAGISLVLPGSEASGKKNGGRTIKQSRKYNIMAVLFGHLLKASLFVGTAIFLWQIYHQAVVSERFHLSDIRFEGAKYVDTKELERVIRSEFPGSSLRLDLRKLQERLELEPWIVRADLRRVLPDALCVSLTERVPKAMAAIGGVPYVIDDEGMVLSKYESRFGKFGLPIVKGILTSDADNFIAENKKRAELFFKVAEALDSSGVKYSKEVSEIDVSNPNNVVLLPMNDTVLIYIGDRNFLKRYQRFLSNVSEVQRQKETHGAIEAVDLRFEGQIVIIPKV
jgi:cell division protein FtsQ